MTNIRGKPDGTCDGFNRVECQTIILAVACFIGGFVACYFLFREPQLKPRAITPAPISYAFDQSFMQQFGADGVRAVNRIMRRGVSERDNLDRQFRLELAVEQVRYDLKLGE